MNPAVQGRGLAEPSATDGIENNMSKNLSIIFYSEKILFELDSHAEL